MATDGGSKVIFVKAMRNAGIRVDDILVIFFYDIFDFSKSDLFDLKINMHSLCTWKDIINYIEKNKLYSDTEITNLNFFLSNPEDWRRVHE